MAIAFIDLAAQRERLQSRLQQRIQDIAAHGRYIMGSEVAELEDRLAEYSGARHCVTCANSTDALTLALVSENVGYGDGVFVPSFTFATTAEAPAQLRASPVFIDAGSDSYNISPTSLRRAIQSSRKNGLRPKAIIAVDLFGLPANYHELFPSKPLGCYDDGGAVFTNDDQRAENLRPLRFHGMGTDKYNNVRIGLNSRLDTLQATILLEKLGLLPEKLDQRGVIAKHYAEGLAAVDGLVLPKGPQNGRAAWAVLHDRVRHA